MFVGLQLEAPLGWGSFMAGTRYYFCGDRSDEVNGVSVPTVLIACFLQSDKRWQSWRVQLFMIPRQEFEEALTQSPPKLKQYARQYNLPPWLVEVDDVDFNQIDEHRQAHAGRDLENGEGASICSYRKQVEGRLNKIAPALEVAIEILRAPDPLKKIYQVLKVDKACQPHRVQLWFFAFVLHGENQWALKRPTHMIGRWLRSAEQHKGKKLGRPSLAGTSFGWSTVGMHDKIVGAYLKRCGPAITMRSIHRVALREEFGCTTVKDRDGVDTWVHPANQPFPSYGQFRFVVVQALGLEQVQTKIYGQDRMKAKAKVNQGNQTGQYASILEALQVDAYYVADRPRAMHSDDPSEPLVVAEAVCVTTGAVVGIGFSLGSETGEAYRSMLFCMAVQKDYVARLYGIPTDKLDWQIQGIGSAFTSDRGPAGHRKLAERLEQQFPIKTIAPSYDGQAKAPVETTHPKSTKLEGAPSYVLSDLNVMGMVKREICRAATKNHSKDISLHLSEQAIHDFHNARLVATPHHYWQYLCARMRTHARQISLEEAVRSFWSPVKLAVDRDGVKFKHRHYSSNALLESPLMKMVGLTKGLQVQAYMLSLVARIIWVDIGGRLMELEATTRVRVDDEDILVPLSQLAETEKLLREIQSRTRESAQAAVSRAEADFQEMTGVRWDAGQRKKGSPPKPKGSAAHEAKVLKGKTSGRRAA
ncbi:MAG: hypothetical protein Q7J58_10935 [Hydrogenophaga sp.]|uniref:hypothetical protein n=1 Tax=Hydrogenophaga sp. TaxID=1904254 RepID=UPI00271696D7|nr:hypothetical protein [Hydrogenophaga sp.]MDO9569882.1 hypothetical protein [Hydrogenophaga sp.]MDP3926510.1 hypothetical protein [Hydrogenophaga sp.]